MDMGLEAAEFPETETNDAPEPVSARGFKNPEVLARAQETRRANREARQPGSLPGEEAGSDGEGAAKRGRGRPKGSGGGSRSNAAMEMMLIGIHMSAATAVAHLTGRPELADIITIDHGEAKILAAGLDGLLTEFKIKISPKAAAIAGFVNAMAIVYGPRAIAIAAISRKPAVGGNDNNPNA